MPSEDPTKRPTDSAFVDKSDPALPRELLNLPWIDAHNHAQTLSWSDRERYALSGCRAMVTVASGYHWTPYKPVEPDDIRYLWDSLINRRLTIERNHFFEMAIALGVHTGVRIERPDELVDAMDGYCQLDEVVALGETGITPSQHVCRWEVDEQRAVVGTQMELADDHGLPVILHTPNQGTGAGGSYRPGFPRHGYEKPTSLTQDPVLGGENPALEAVKIDLDVADDAGLADEQIVASHADSNNAGYLLEQTDCYLSFTIGYPWLTGVNPATVADVVETYGPDRVLLDTDCANVLRTDVFSLKRAIFELYRLGLDVSDIRTIVFENPREVFGIGG